MAKKKRMSPARRSEQLRKAIAAYKTKDELENQYRMADKVAIALTRALGYGAGSTPQATVDAIKVGLDRKVGNILAGVLQWCIDSLGVDAEVALAIINESIQDGRYEWPDFPHLRKGGLRALKAAQSAASATTKSDPGDLIDLAER